MFDRHDIYVGFIDDNEGDEIVPDFNVDDNDNDTNQVSNIVAAIHKHQLKKNANLSKDAIADPAGVILYEYIKLAGVKADSLKQVVKLLTNEKKIDPKTSSDISQITIHLINLSLSP